MKRAKATWYIELKADCPYCDNWTDCFCAYHDQECYTVVDFGQSKELDHRHNKEDLIVECDKCHKSFVISHIEN